MMNERFEKFSGTPTRTLPRRTRGGGNARRKRRQGFTFVELSLGLIVTAMIMCAVAGIMTATAQGWSQGQTTQSIQMQANQVFARVQKVLSSAKYVGYTTAGSVADGTAPAASIFFWRADDYPDGATSDASVETGEMALIQEDPTTHTLWLYQAIPYSQMTPAQLTSAGVKLAYSDMTNPASPAEFAALNFVAATPLGGPGNLADTGYLHVNAAQFYVQGLASTSQLPVIEFALSFSRNNQTTILYGSSTLRAPTTQPN